MKKYFNNGILIILALILIIITGVLEIALAGKIIEIMKILFSM